MPPHHSSTFLSSTFSNSAFQTLLFQTLLFHTLLFHTLLFHTLLWILQILILQILILQTLPAFYTLWFLHTLGFTHVFTYVGWLLQTPAFTFAKLCLCQTLP
jgi:hypothetical protein